MKFSWSERKSKGATPSKGEPPLINVPEADILDATEAAQHGADEFSLFRDAPLGAVARAPVDAQEPDKPATRGLFARKVASPGDDDEVLDVQAHEPAVHALPVDGEQVVAVAPSAAAKSSWFKGREKKTKVDGSPPSGGGTKRKLKLPKHDELPVQVVFGFLPEVSARDAQEYAMGIAEKHFSQPGLTYFYATEYENGYAYEVHEGGEGKAFLPAIVNYFGSQGPYQNEEHVSVVVETSMRKLEVLRQRVGFVGLLLPEESDKRQPEWLVATKSMPPVVNRQRNFFISGLVVFVTGVLAMTTTALFFRLQGYLPPNPPKLERISTQELPRSQWSRIEALPGEASIKAIRFRADKWQDIELEGAEPAPVPAQTTPATPPTRTTP